MIDVIVVGAGPAGLLLAYELRLAGVETVVFERDHQRPGFCRGFNLNARSLDLLARRGLAGELIAQGWKVPHAAFSGLPVTLDLEGAHTDHPYSLGIPQTLVEEILERHAGEIRRGQEVVETTQDDDAVTATLGSGERVRARYLVGCDGSRSTVRKQAGIPFPGSESTQFSLLGDVEADGLPFGAANGVFVIPRPGYVRVITADPAPHEEPTLGRLQSAVAERLGRPVEMRNPRWVTRFGNAARLASEYVRGRVILAGDAAHIHPPAGAIGVNVALDDAFNLGWKLASTVRGNDLLATYHAERHAAGARVLANTQAQTQFAEGPVKDLLTRIAAHPDGNRAFAEIITGLDRGLVLNVSLADGTLCDLLAEGRGILLNPPDGWTNPGGLKEAACPGLPTTLIRPDGHTAWAGDDPRELETALAFWFGGGSGD